MGLILLVIVEVIAPTGSIGNPFRVVIDARARVRRGRRYAQVLTVIAKHGLSSSLRIGARKREPWSARSTARSLAAALSDAGVTFIKLGQMLSSRPDIIPEPYVSELSRLQDNAPALPWERLEPVLAGSLREPVGRALSNIDPEPLAAASIGQVHAATLTGGTAVVVKIRRPGEAEQVQADLDIMLRLARRLERTAGWAQAIGALRLAQGFADALGEELDYRIEAENVAAVAASLTGSTPISVPRVHREISGPAVLVMDRVRGTSLGQADTILPGWEHTGAPRSPASC